LGVRRLPGSGRLVLSAARLVHGVFQRPGRPGDYTAWGVVVLDMDWSRLLGFFHRLPSAQVLILDRRGRLLAAPGRRGLLGKNPAELRLARGILGKRDQAGPDAFTWKGVRYLGALRRVSPAAGLVWTVLVRTELATVMRPAGKVRLVIMGVTLVCLLLAAGGIFYAARIITKPIDRLVEHTQRVAKGDLAARVEEPRIREVALLARSFNRMSGELENYIEELKRTTAEKERLASEMAIAAQLQKSVLPQAPPRLPGWDLAGDTLPARETGGDFYDYLALPAGGLGLVLADVSGKGLPAALFMLSTRAYLRTLALGGLPPHRVLAGANRQVAADSGVSGMFVTTFYAQLDPESGRLRYANAGHNPPLVLRCDKEEMEELGRTGLPLGVLEEEDYQLSETVLRPGDTLLVYSDGVTEAPDRDHAEWGVGRLQDQLRRGCRLGAAELIGRIQQEVESWSGDQPQFDDMTLLVLARRS
jgi:sigma-B regulation protein RsbU (phosphoserine phosphatase)